MTLTQYLTSRLSMPFAWGENDCVIFVARWVQIATGTDLLEGVKPWTSEQQAMRMIARRGGLEKAVDKRLERINPNLARDGHVALYGDGRLGLFSGAHIVAPGPDGLGRISRLEAKCAWRY